MTDAYARDGGIERVGFDGLRVRLAVVFGNVDPTPIPFRYDERGVHSELLLLAGAVASVVAVFVRRPAAVVDRLASLARRLRE